VPETWPVRIRQIMRWAKGHNQALANYGLRCLLGKSCATVRERLDGFLLLGVYAMAPTIVIGWILALALFYRGIAPLGGTIALLAFTSYATVGNSAAFFQIAAAGRLDGRRQRIRLVPFVMLGFVVSIIAVSRATLSQLLALLTGAEFHWDKTERFRRVS
jgi:cellulose synthase/poly-beta-1,6-N-acetylglucosamine synthase-like glycosyltransferase